MTIDHVIRMLPAWGELHFLRQLEGGYRNTVLLVEGHGRLLVAKSTRRSIPAIEWVQHLHPMVKAADLVMPAFVRSLRGRLIEGGVTVEEWIDGIPLDDAHQAAAAEAIGRFHTTTRDWPQRPGFASSQELLKRTLGGDVDLGQMPVPLVRICREAWAALEGQPQSVVHGDVSLSNMLLTSDDRVALVDWDEARFDISAFDLVTFLAGGEGANGVDARRLRRAFEAWEVAVCWQVEPEHAKVVARQLIDDGD